jgi:membrane fusion protein, multidrug efflux system
MFRPEFILSRLAFALFIAAGLAACSKAPSKTEDVRPVRAITLSAAQQQLVAEYSGNVQARVESQLGFRVSGKIQQRKVDVGSLVKPGQVLMQLDPQDLQLAQTQAQANLKAAQSNYELAGFELKRYEDLRKTNAISQSALDAKKTAFDAAKASWEQAQAAFKTSSNQSGYATLVADVAGVVTAINAEVGQVVAAGTPVVQVAKAGELEVVVGVPENSVDLVTRANDVQIRLWADKRTALPGKIRELSPMADPATRTFTAKVTITDPQQAQRIKLGMTASVQFAVNTPGAFVKVPLTALYQSKGATSVWIVEQGKVKLVPVQVVGVNGNDILLSDGVSAGQTVVTAGVHVLNPGQPVTVLPPEPEATAPEPYLTAQSLLAQPAANTQPATATQSATSTQPAASTQSATIKGTAK